MRTEAATAGRNSMNTQERMRFPRERELQALVGKVLTETSQRLERMGQKEGWDSQTAFRANLVLEEVLTNVITHGGGDDEASPSIWVSMESSPEAVRMEVLDDGIPFDPLQDAPGLPDMRTLEQARMGGVGIHLVVKMTDQMGYRREDGRNRLTMTLNRPREEDEGKESEGAPS